MSEELVRMEKNMTIDSHSGGSEEYHSRRKVKKENTKANGKRMSQAEFDKDMAAIREEHNVLTMLLEESQRLGWVLRKKTMKWHKLQRRLR